MKVLILISFCLVFYQAEAFRRPLPYGVGLPSPQVHTEVKDNFFSRLWAFVNPQRMTVSQEGAFLLMFYLVVIV